MKWFLGLAWFLVLGCFSSAQAAWTTQMAYSKATEHRVEILEAVMKDTGFYDKTTIKIGCRYSYPMPSIYIKLPALTTDLMTPSIPAKIYFYGVGSSMDSGYMVSGIVGIGDTVVIPVGNEEQEKLLDDIYIMFSDKEDNGVLMTFFQGRHSFTYFINLENFTSSFYLAKSTCANIAAEDEQIKSNDFGF